MLKLIKDEKLEVPMLIHFRIATAGGTRPELCHPFPISKNCPNDLVGRAKRVMIHNGHWAGWGTRTLVRAMKSRDVVPKGHWSDTRALAWLAWAYGDGLFDMIDGQRIATMNHEGRISLYGQGWSEDDGVHYSNCNWKKSYGGKYNSGYTYVGDESWEERFARHDKKLPMLVVGDKDFTPANRIDHSAEEAKKVDARIESAKVRKISDYPSLESKLADATLAGKNANGQLTLADLARLTLEH